MVLVTNSTPQLIIQTLCLINLISLGTGVVSLCQYNSYVSLHYSSDPLPKLLVTRQLLLRAADYRTEPDHFILSFHSSVKGVHCTLDTFMASFRIKIGALYKRNHCAMAVALK